MWTIQELLLEDGASPFATWFSLLQPDVAAKVAVAQLRMQMGNLSNVDWFRGIGFMGRLQMPQESHRHCSQAPL
jgi:hypothetical protein